MPTRNNNDDDDRRRWQWRYQKSRRRRRKNRRQGKNIIFGCNCNCCRCDNDEYMLCARARAWTGKSSPSRSKCVVARISKGKHKLHAVAATTIAAVCHHQIEIAHRAYTQYTCFIWCQSSRPVLFFFIYISFTCFFFSFFAPFLSLTSRWININFDCTRANCFRNEI